MATPFQNAWEWAKDHPYVIAGGVLLLIIVFWLSGRSSSAPASAPTVLGADPNILAYNSMLEQSRNALQLGLAQTAASTEQASIQAEAFGHYVDVAGGVAGQQAQLQADTAAHYFDTALAASKDANSTAFSIQENQTWGQIVGIMAQQDIIKFLAPYSIADKQNPDQTTIQLANILAQSGNGNLFNLASPIQ